MPGRLIAMAGAHQRWLVARLEHNRRQLHARTVTDGLTQATAALAETMLHGEDEARPEVWRLAAARTSQLLAMLNLGATSLGQPLPVEAVRLIQGLRTWSVTMAENPQSSGTENSPPTDPGRGVPRGQIARHELRPGGTPVTVGVGAGATPPPRALLPRPPRV
jgi:hypothetical protein